MKRKKPKAKILSDAEVEAAIFGRMSELGLDRSRLTWTISALRQTIESVQRANIRFKEAGGTNRMPGIIFTTVFRIMMELTALRSFWEGHAARTGPPERKI